MKRTHPPLDPTTRVVHMGRDSTSSRRFVNPPTFRGSTVIFADWDEFQAATEKPFDGLYYGRFGTPTSQALEKALAELYGVSHAFAMASGLAAIALSLLACLKRGDSVLLPHSAYGPTTKLADQFLNNFGITTRHYSPRDPINQALSPLIDSTAKVIFIESPGSLTFDVQDIAAITTIARRHKIITICDNTWATGLYCRPHEHGVDIAVEAATKYLSGHADAMIGVIACQDKILAKRLKKTITAFGDSPGSAECSLALRGLRTLPLRLARHQRSAMAMATWLKKRPEVKRVLHPAFTDCPGHVHWPKYYQGASGLFAIELHDPGAIKAMVNSLNLFGLGYSWGGYESLALPAWPKNTPYNLPLLRLHIGLEDVHDLQADLDQGLRKLQTQQRL